MYLCGVITGSRDRQLYSPSPLYAPQTLTCAIPFRPGRHGYDTDCESDSHPPGKEMNWDSSVTKVCVSVCLSSLYALTADSRGRVGLEGPTPGGQGQAWSGGCSRVMKSLSCPSRSLEFRHARVE